MSYPLIGRLLRITKFSARIIMKRVNCCYSFSQVANFCTRELTLDARICSISSACLILMLIRTEFIEGSISTCSAELRATVIGVSSASRVFLLRAAKGHGFNV